MKFNPLKLQLKNGKMVEIREGRISDAEDLKYSLKVILGDMEYPPLEEDEINLTIQQEIDWLRVSEKIPTSLNLIVTHENRIIGYLGIYGNNMNKTRHTANISISLAKQWQHLGLGCILMEEALKWAKENTELKVIWLDVYSINSRAIHLYRKLGFFEEGRIRDFVRLKDGYCNKVIMSLNLNYFINMR